MPRILARLLVAAALAATARPPCRRASSLSGAYLAAMQADFRDDYAEAALYFDQALALDPANVGLLTNAVVAAGRARRRRRRPRRWPTGWRRPTRTTRWRRWCGSATRWRRATSRRRQAVLDKAAEHGEPAPRGTARRLDRGRPRGLRRRQGQVRRDDRQRRADRLRPVPQGARPRLRRRLRLAPRRILAGGRGGPAAPQPLLDRRPRRDPRPDRPRGRRDQGDRRRAGGRRARRAAARPARAPRRRRGGALRPGRPSARDGAAEAFLTLADALNTDEFAAGGAGARPHRGAHPPRPDRGAASSPPRSSRPRTSSCWPPRRWPTCPRPRPGTSPPRSAAPTPSAPPATPTPASPR